MTNQDLPGGSDIEKILIFSPSFLSQSQLVSEILAVFPHNLVMLADPVKSEAEVLKLIEQYQATAVLVGHEPIGASTLNQAKSLKAVVKYGVGLENLDVDAFSQSDVQLFYPLGINKVAVSELVIAHLLNHFRMLPGMIEDMREGRWQRRESSSLSALTLGIVGFGNIGQCLTSLVKPFGIKILFHDIADRRAEGKQLGAIAADYETILRESDCISFHVPLTPLTQNMFSKKELEKVKSTALIINTSRGAVVDHLALVHAVHANKIGGYAADVFYEEPLPLNVLHKHPHIYLTPHIGAFSLEARLAMGRFCIDALRNFFLK